MPTTSTTFRTVSLGDWLEVCREADVPHVSATEVASAPVSDLMHFDADPLPESLSELWAKIQAAKQTGYMMRWDCCASLDVKSRLANGKWQWHERVADVTFDDPRFFDLLFEYPGDTMRVWKRPWVQAEIVDGYPVEYRAFVQDGEIIGISSYYPQRPLSKTWYVGNDVDYWLPVFVSRLLKCLPERDSEGLNGCSMDFMRLQNGNLVFLEGGPPHLPDWGAHPCCFKPGEIEGVALSYRN